MRRGLLASLLAGAGLLAVTPPARAVPMPDLGLQLGRTFAVGSEVDGAFDQGGPHVELGMLWPWQRFRFGVSVFGSDLGHVLEQISVTDPNDGTVRYYGTVEQAHLDVWGLAWRTDVIGPRIGKLGDGVASLSYGFSRFEADDVGIVKAANSAVAGTLALGIEHTLTSRQSLALWGAGTLLSDDYTKHYASVSLEWRWRWHGPAADAKP